MPAGSQAWYIVLPTPGVMLGDNPSYEKGTTGAGAIQGATLGSTSQYQQFGAWSLSVTPSSNGTSGAYLGTAAAGNGTAYSYSAYVRGVNGVSYMLAVADTSNALLGSVAFVGGGTWHRYVGSYTEASGANRRVIVRKNGDADTSAYYADGWNFGPGSVQTYLDGDQEGCQWSGLAHQSQSQRSGQSRAGGSVVSLASLGLIIGEHLGAGMPPLEVHQQRYAVLPGAEFQGVRTADRSFTLVNTIVGTSRESLHVTRAAIIDALKIDAVTPQQPCRFLYMGGFGTVAIDAIYEDGLGGHKVEGFTEVPVPIQFLACKPYWKATTDEGTQLSPRANIGSANYVCYRDPLGRWGTMGVSGTTLQAGAAGLVQVWTVLPMDPGTVLVGGIFGSAGGTFVTGLARYNPSTNRWGTLQGGSFTASPGANTIFKLLRTPTGTVIIGGDYVTVGGTACKALCFWHGAYGTFVGGTVGGGYIQDLAYNGTVFFAGSIGGPIGGTATRHIGMHLGPRFGTLTNGTVNDIVDAIALDRQQRLYATGFFTTAGGTTANGAAQHTNGSWGTMGSGLNNSIAGHAILVASDGLPRFGGQFGTAGSVEVNGAAKWQGVMWDQMGDGVQGPSSPGIFAFMQDKRTSLIWGAGLFGTASGLPTSDGLAAFTGYVWISPDIQINNGTFYDLAQSLDGTIYAAGDFSGTAYVASVAQIVNTGKTDVQPIVKLRNTSASGTARIYQLLNPLTNNAIYFNNLVLLANEELTINLGSRTVTSDYRDSLFYTVAPGSDLAHWHLQSGTNYVSLFTDSDSVAASIYWRPTHWSNDGGTIY